MIKLKLISRIFHEVSQLVQSLFIFLSVWVIHQNWIEIQKHVLLWHSSKFLKWFMWNLNVISVAFSLALWHITWIWLISLLIVIIYFMVSSLHQAWFRWYFIFRIETRAYWIIISHSDYFITNKILYFSYL